MLNFHILTLFPEMVMQGLNTSIIGKAAQRGDISIEAVNIRDYTLDRHGKVDDYTYGGGAGMLMQAQPVYDAWRSVVNRIGEERARRVVYVTPQGKTFHQEMAQEMARESDLIFLCGHYEGIDERVLEEIVTDEVSIGDYVLTGGELPAMVMIDAIARLVPGVLHNGESAQTESFENGLLEYPQYSRPEIWHEKRVPEILLSGDHAKVEAWRLEQSLLRTKERRPDLYEKYLQIKNPLNSYNRDGQWTDWDGDKVYGGGSGGSAESSSHKTDDGPKPLTDQDIAEINQRAEAEAVQQAASDEGFADVGDMYRAAEKNMSAGEFYNNAVVSTPGIENAVTVGQGGNLIVNGQVTNMSATISKVTNRAYVDSVRIAQEGRVLNVVDVSYPVVEATINFYMPGITGEENIVALQYCAGTWVNVEVAEVRADHIILNMKGNGVVAFIAK